MILNKKFYPSLYSFLISNNFESLLSSEENILLTIDEIKNLKKILLESYLKIYCDKSLSDEKYFLGIANTKLIELVFQIVFNFIVKKKNEKYSYNIHQNFFEKKFYFNTLSNFKKAYHLSKIFFDKKMNEFIHNKSNFAYNIGQKSSISNLYCKEVGLQEIKFNRFFFSNKKSYLDLKMQTHILESTNKFIDLINKKIVEINNDYKVILKKQINEKLFSSINFIRSVTLNLKKTKNTTVLSLSNGSPVNRAFLAGSRLAGVKTVGFLHGNPYATLLGTSVRVFDESFSIADEVFLNSKGEYNAAKKIIKDFRHIIKTPNLKYPNKSLYLNINNKLRTSKLEKDIKTIMIIGGSQYGLFNTSSNIIGDYPSTYYAIFELKILKILKNSNYKIIYQAHPSFPKKLKNTFLKYVSEINIGNFEGNLHNIDCIIFPSIGSTTFGYALMTNKAIVAFKINSNHEYCNLEEHPYRLKLLNERCKIVEYINDINDRPDFDRIHLINAIEESYKLKNYQIVQEFALS